MRRQEQASFKIAIMNQFSQDNQIYILGYEIIVPHHSHTSKYILIYRNIVLLHYLLTKDATEKSGLSMPVMYIPFVIICQPIKTFSIRFWCIYNFHFPCQQRTCFVYEMKDLQLQWVFLTFRDSRVNVFSRGSICCKIDSKHSIPKSIFFS